MDTTQNDYDKALERIQDCLEKKQTTLYLSHLKLERLPPEISELSNLKSLYMVDVLTNPAWANNYSSIPALEYLNIDSGAFIWLRPFLRAPLRHLDLELRNDSANAALDTLAALASLEQITIEAYGNEVIIPESIQDIRGLSYLRIDNAVSIRFPETTKNLDRLEMLSLSGHLRNVRQGLNFGELILPQTLLLRSLKVLRISDLYMSNPLVLENLCGLKNLTLQISVASGTAIHGADINGATNSGATSETPPPVLFTKLTALEELTLTTGDINATLDAIANPAALKQLTFYDHTTQVLSDSIGAFRSLEKLSITSKSLHALPETFGNLASLEYFNMKYSAIRHLPASFGALSSLTRLEADGSALEALPASIGRLKKLSSFTATKTKLKKLPASIGGLTALKYFDISGTALPVFPHTLAKCRLLSVNRKWLRTINVTSRVITFLAGKYRFITRLQKSFYDYVYERLDAYQKKLDVCGPHTRDDKPVCRRYYDQCCTSGGHCSHLAESGCSVKSICCKFWLCGKALEYVASIMSATSHPLRKTCVKYLKLRERYDILCRAFAIPLKGRCSKEDAFNPADKKSMNIYTDHWYNNIVLRQKGLFVPVETAVREYRVPFFQGGKK
jgi:Leucine-rich repeat (LRR) protein